MPTSIGFEHFTVPEGGYVVLLKAIARNPNYIYIAQDHSGVVWLYMDSPLACPIKSGRGAGYWVAHQDARYVSRISLVEGTRRWPRNPKWRKAVARINQ